MNVLLLLVICIGITISYAQDKHESCEFWASTGEVRYIISSFIIVLTL